ncbi:MAG: hypothetical protein D3920_00840 [Candidatus Electrothrix sp. AW2]|nr:hypothetical protein [Candidatus Electrothrix gigas]
MTKAMKRILYVCNFVDDCSDSSICPHGEPHFPFFDCTRLPANCPMSSEADCLCVPVKQPADFGNDPVVDLEHEESRFVTQEMMDNLFGPRDEV